eukprot:CAMPEP_0196770332 /NCGR_PEP_ID=MMETSP1104-20130614/1081_1 /TAXON_ID=33652 /ORGANISM="Cafeteria sp., Strain Caron Lab Isolate" /LENGTH=146 /DNA_ID=CAMNT_0042140443 /DNA_START=181 /DNA_END=619 /DNA_ORIENTATION=+
MWLLLLALCTYSMSEIFSSHHHRSPWTEMSATLYSIQLALVLVHSAAMFRWHRPRMAFYLSLSQIALLVAALLCVLFADAVAIIPLVILIGWHAFMAFVAYQRVKMASEGARDVVYIPADESIRTYDMLDDGDGRVAYDPVYNAVE